MSSVQYTGSINFSINRSNTGTNEQEHL